jgi:CRISPR-associated protein Cas2
MMYVILVYDINVDRVDRVRKFLRQSLIWVQNSVFEGQLTEAQFERVRVGLKEMIDEAEDAIVIYQLSSQKWVNRSTLGLEKNPTDNLL